RVFLFQCFGQLLYLDSFPTRRSSDLLLPRVGYSFFAVPSTALQACSMADSNSSCSQSSMAFRTELPTFIALEPNVTPKWNTKSRSEEHTSELQSRGQLVCRLLLEKKK